MKLCAGPLWNTSETWNTTDPDFTKCFHDVVLPSVPLCYLVALTPIEIYFMWKTVARPIPFCVTNLLRTLGIVLLLVPSLCSLWPRLTDHRNIEELADVIHPSVEILSFFIALILNVANIRRGVNSSGIVFGFWTLTFICQASTYTSVIRFEREYTPLLLTFIKFALISAVYFSHFFADSSRNREDYEELEPGKPSPHLTSSFPNKLVFLWMTSYLFKGWKKPLTREDLWDLAESVKSSNVYAMWTRTWDKLSNRTNGKQSVGVVWMLTKNFGLGLVMTSLLQLASVLLTQVTPQFLRHLINYMSNDEPDWRGYFYMAGLVGTDTVVSILGSQYSLLILIMSQKIKSSLTCAIYNKYFKLTSLARRERSIGQSVNLIQLDTQNIQDVLSYLNLAWATPMAIILSFYSLWGLLGPSCMAGLGVLLLLVPINAYLKNKMKDYNRATMKLKDSRIKTMNEILDGMKVMKFYAWERSFQEKVTETRLKEVEKLKKFMIFNAMQKFVFVATPFAVAVSTFATYVLSDPKNRLQADTAFVALSYFNIMKNQLKKVPGMMNALIQAQVSVERINSYLNSEEIDPDAIKCEDEGETVVRVTKGTFSWEPEEPPVLKDINIEIKKGQLVAVVGRVGAGKSSLLSVFLNELVRTDQDSEINIRGKLSYVAQQGWMQNNTLRNNILFGKQFNKEFYQKVLDACALEPDLKILPGGDSTEIGEKGINLSGGQKQRISMARALYNDGDIYLLDDPLSAVDAHVGKHMFNEVLGPEGLLKDKTRILVTHGVSFLPNVDKIVVMKDGKISEVGTYRELLSNGAEFSVFLNEYGQEDQTEDNLKNEGEIESDEESSGSVETLVSESSEDDILEHEKVLRRISSREKGPNEVVQLIHKEHMETKAVDIEVHKFYLRSIGVSMIVFIVFLNIIQAALVASTGVWLNEWTEDNNKNVAATRNMYLGIYGLLGLLSSIFQGVAFAMLTICSLSASNKFHDKMLKSVLGAPMSFFDTNPKGRIINRFAKDLDYMDKKIPKSYADIINYVLALAGTLIVICSNLPIFIVVVLVSSIGYYALQKFYQESSRQLRRLESTTRSPVYSWFGESVNGVTTIKAYGLADSFGHEMGLRVDENSKTVLPTFTASAWLSMGTQILGNLIILIASLLAIMDRDRLDKGTVGLVLNCAMAITDQLSCVFSTVGSIENNMVSAERIKEYQDSVPQEAERKYDHDPEARHWPSGGNIRIEGLEMRYREGLPLVLKQVNLDIKSGEKVGIVGRTGSGKSSLILSLFRINEASGGCIEIDDHDISHLGLETLRSAITIIPQDPVLFSGSLRLNLDPFSQYSDQEVWAALETAHLRTYISSLSDGLSFQIAEGGTNMAVGHRQLVCLARACLRKAKILLLDEATASIDLETDDLIQHTIREVFADSTILTIAHRINTIMDSDKVVVMSDGIVEELNTPENLLNNEHSLFYSLAKEAQLI